MGKSHPNTQCDDSQREKCDLKALETEERDVVKDQI